MRNPLQAKDKAQTEAIVQGLNTLERVLTELTEGARSTAVFGEPVQHNDTLVIPCAEVTLGLGMGAGTGSGKEDDEEGSGGGSGGGGGAYSRPVAAIVVKPDHVRVEPVVDATKVVLAVLTTLAFVVYWINRLSAGRSAPGSDPDFDEVRKAIQG
jgi:uncharacterized spore protein YtfJ